MNVYEEMVKKELTNWQRSLQKAPKPTDQLAKNVQDKLNQAIPQKIHMIVTGAIKTMVQTVLFGSKYSSKKTLYFASLKHRDQLAKESIKSYTRSAMVSGFTTGAGGLALGMADFPILLTIQIKFLYDLAGIYGYNCRNFKERIYLLYIFQLAFSSYSKRKETLNIILNWDKYSKNLPVEKDFDWQIFQQEYRDYIDFAKMLQLVPGIGAVVGVTANRKLMKRLGSFGMQCYRLRILQENSQISGRSNP